MDKKDLAIWLHRNYEEIASEKNWETQKDCKTDFEDLPEKNKKTMLQLAERIKKDFYIRIDLNTIFQGLIEEKKEQD